MKQKPGIAQDVAVVLVVGFYMLVYIVMLLFEESLGFAMLMMACSPFMLAGLVLAVLRGEEYRDKLDQDEFGYPDKRRKGLKVF